MPGSDLLVGLDVGTTGSKAVAFDIAGRAVSSGRADTPWVHIAGDGDTPPGTELDAHALLRTAATAVAQALDGAPDGRVVGLGVTSMAESGVLLDGRGEPVAPVVAWHDSRDQPEVDRLAHDLGAATFNTTTGLPLRSQWSLTKHRRQLETEPAAATAVRRLNIAEWVVRGLGGDEASDASLASRTGWLDLAARDWWTDAVDWSGADTGLFAPLVTSGTALGRAGADCGVARLVGAVLTTAGHDHQAAALGAQAAAPDDQLDSCGTAEALVRTVPAGLSATGVAALAAGGVTVGWHVLPERWALLGATEGGLVLQRVLSMLGGRDHLSDLDAGSAALTTTAGLHVTLDGSSRVTVRDIGDGITPAHVWLAALAETTEQMAAINAAMSAVVGPHRRMVVTGGWSRSAGVMAHKAQAFGELTPSGVEEAGARGAALLAGLAAGVYASRDELPLLVAQ